MNALFLSFEPRDTTEINGVPLVPLFLYISSYYFVIFSSMQSYSASVSQKLCRFPKHNCVELEGVYNK